MLAKSRVLITAAVAAGCAAPPPAAEPPRAAPAPLPAGAAKPAAPVATSKPAQPAEPARPESEEPSPPAARLSDLEVDGFPNAIVSAPPDGSAKPLLVAVHGAADTPARHCDIWNRALGTRGFALCLRGKKYSGDEPTPEQTYYFPSHRWLLDNLNAATAALKARFGDRVDTDGAVYVGYSQGAIMGGEIITPAPQRFPRAVLVEGGSDSWNIPRSRTFRKGGGERILLLCGVKRCADRAIRAGHHLKGAAIHTRVLHTPGAGHAFAGPVLKAALDNFEWVVDGDARWAGSS